MKKIFIGAMTLFFLATTSGWVLAQGINPSSGVSGSTSTKDTKKSKKGHGCHGKKCSKNSNSTTTTK